MCVLSGKRRLCFLLILFVVLSGLYFADNRKEYYFTYITENNETVHLCIKGNNLLNQELCSEEVSGMHGMGSTVFRGRGAHRCMDSRIEIILLSVEMFLVFPAFIIIMKTRGMNEEISGTRVVIEYIHHQDGEKG